MLKTRKILSSIDKMSAVACKQSSQPLIMQFRNTLEAMTDVSPSDLLRQQYKHRNRHSTIANQPPATFPQMTRSSELPKLPKSNSWSYALSF